MKVKIARAANPGFTIGKATLQKVRISPQPSILADSSNSVGIFSLNCFMRKTPNGHPIKGKITAQRVSWIPMKLTIRTNGTRTTCFGSAMAAIKMAKRIR